MSHQECQDSPQKLDERVSNLPSESEIIGHWKGNIDQPVVSICCATFNHESYVEDALKGFLMQETEFPFEILIHDDASTDKTASLIQKYERLYPKLIKAMYQVENKYSKGIKINPAFNFPRARGNYIAMCEGDDYWVSQHKLQKQCSAIKAYAVSVVFHPAIEDDLHSGINKTVCNHRQGNGYIPLIDSVKGRGGFMPTASLFFSASIIKDKLGWFDSSMPLGDFFLQMILSYHGEIYYLDEPMCVYRRNAPGSWTENQRREGQVNKYACAMLPAIIKLHSRLGSVRYKHYLAYPFFVYSKACHLKKSNITIALFRMFNSIPKKKDFLVFTLVYYKLLFLLPFSFLAQKLSLRRNR